METDPLHKMAAAGCTKGFHGKDLTLFHLGVVGIFGEWYGLASVDSILVDVMSTDATDRLDRECPAIDIHFITFHHFLNGSADITNTNIDPGVLEQVSRVKHLTKASGTLMPVLVASFTAASRLS